LSLISIAIWDTEENNRSHLTKETLRSLEDTVDWKKNRLIIYDNNSCPQTKQLLDYYTHSLSLLNLEVIYGSKNIGTARGINQVWLKRCPGETCIKMDNDIVIHQKGWIEQMEEVFRRDSQIGICGLKRKDLMERPDYPDPWFKSTIRMLPHSPGETWMIIEEVFHVMGSCQAYRSELLDKIGYLYQMGGLYGFDDSLAAVRASVAGFKSVFLPSINIDHIDSGGTVYTDWKHEYAGEYMSRYSKLREEIETTGKVFYGPEDE